MFGHILMSLKYTTENGNSADIVLIYWKNSPETAFIPKKKSIVPSLSSQLSSSFIAKNLAGQPYRKKKKMKREAPFCFANISFRADSYYMYSYKISSKVISVFFLLILLNNYCHVCKEKQKRKTMNN